VTVSKETYQFLEYQTNNYQFVQTFVEMKGIGQEPIYAVMPLRGRKRRPKFSKDKKMTKKLDLASDLNEYDSASAGNMSDRGLETNRKLLDEPINNENNFSDGSNSDDEVDQDTMNLFNFNDDLNADDR